MSEWNECRIGKVVTLRQGLCINSKTKHLLANKGHVLLRITDLINGTEIQYIDENIPKKFLATKKDLIFSRTGQVGLVFKGREGVVYNNCFTVSPTEEIDSDYLYWFLKTKFAYDYANGVASGAAQLDLNHDSFRSMYISYPEKKVQQQIASILTAYDNLIETNNQRIATLEQLAQQIYKEWFVRMRFPGWEHTPHHHGIPDGWKIEDLGEIITLEYGKSLVQESRLDGSIPVYGSSGMVGFHNKSLVNSPGIIVGRKGNVGAIHFVNQPFYPIDTVFYVVPKVQNWFFLFFILKTKILLIPMPQFQG